MFGQLEQNSQALFAGKLSIKLAIGFLSLLMGLLAELVVRTYYERIATEVFPRLTNVDRLLLEYDTPRAGDFSPLGRVRPGAEVVLGLLTTKQGALEDAAAVQARIAEAARYVPLEGLALSPQCGFASGEAGNPLTPAEQEAKLRLIGALARHVWGS